MKQPAMNEQIEFYAWHRRRRNARHKTCTYSGEVSLQLIHPQVGMSLPYESSEPFRTLDKVVTQMSVLLLDEMRT